MSTNRKKQSFKSNDRPYSKSSYKANSKSRPKSKPGKKPGKKIEKPSVRVSFLGGLNEIGKNITLIECEGDMILVDCGMAFPDGDMLGVDLVIPDFSYIEQNADKVKGTQLLRLTKAQCIYS